MSKPKAKTKTKTKRINWRKAAVALARCAIYTLSYAKHLGRGSGVTMRRDPKTGKTIVGGPWEDQFFDALDMVGYEIDRKAYFASLNKRAKR